MDELKLYNTSSGKKEYLPKGKIGVYVCGITPYDMTHIGHAFTFISYDVLIRWLRFLGRKVTYCQNLTDIDDDVLAASKKRGISWKELGIKETKKFLEDMKALNMVLPDYYVKATDHIEEMIVIIQELIQKDYAYVSNKNVYFSVKKDPEFGQRLCRLNYEEMLDIANERGNFPLDPAKKDPLDFVLWQAYKKGEPKWKSPWGYGRPGWHIECSAMSTKYLGQPFAIHGGGSDLKFPHHEAEISQSEKANSKKFVLHWMHTGMVYMDGKKMSKSLGNMVFIEDLLREYSASAIRWFLLSHHWRADWNWDENELKDAQKSVQLLTKMVRTAESTKESVTRIFDILNDDLNTRGILNNLLQMVQDKSRRGFVRTFSKDVLGLIFE